MKEKKEHILYTASDIEQYLAGKLTAQEMHAMERAALNDPFLAEALEGYSEMYQKEWNNELVAVREAIQTKGKVAKVIPLHQSKNNWKKIAASILIIVSGIAWYIFSANQHEKPNHDLIVQNNTQNADSITIPHLPPSTSTTASLNPSATVSMEEKNLIPGSQVKKESISSSVYPETIADPGAPQIKAVVPAGSNIQKTDDKINVPVSSLPVNSQADESGEVVTLKNNADNKQKNPDATMNRQQNQPMIHVNKETVLNNFFTAQVVSPENLPLPFSNISIKKENFGTYADVKGMVRLVSTDSILQLEVNSVGYQSKTITLRNNQPPVKIVLQEDEQALSYNKAGSETESANQVRKRTARLLKDSLVNVEPANGWDNYNTYVANNLEIPVTALKKDLHGEVELSFEVKSNGTITNIRVNKSLDAVYDDAAKRLLMEGPQWKVKKGKKTLARVKIQF